MHRTDKYSQHSSIIRPVWLNGWVFVYKLSGCGVESSCSHLNFKFRACFEQGVSWHSGKAIIKCGFTVKRVRDMTRTCSQMHRTDKYSQHSSTIWPLWLNGWVFVFELSGCGVKSSCSHLNFKFRACFEQGVSWHSDYYRVWINSETRTWHNKNIQWNKKCRNLSLVLYCLLKTMKLLNIWVICHFHYLKSFWMMIHSKSISTQWFLLIQNICCNKKGLWFQLVAFKIYAIIKTV